MFSSQLPLGALVEFCRGTRYTLESGLTLAQAMKMQAKKGPRPIRPVAARMAEQLAEGDSFHDVVQEEKRYFPPLFLSISAVAEDTGKLPEALQELEEYFRFQQELWKRFVSEITWPTIQLVLAILVISLLIWILGIIPGNTQITVLGLKGETGVVTFLSIVVSIVVLGIAGYWFARTILKKGHIVDNFLLSIPVLGTTLRTLAMSRFSLSMAITVEAGTPIGDATALSLKATNNHAFAVNADSARAAIKAGESLTQALRETRIFPEEFVDIVDTAEVGGREGEMFQKQAELYREDAMMKMRLLARFASMTVWAMVAIFIIIMIFSIAMQYINALNSSAKSLGL